MSRLILGYSEDPYCNAEGEYDFGNHTVRTYKFRPIHETPRGAISTASVLLCGQCRSSIKSMGGPGWRSYCIKCYDVLKLTDFVQGHEHEIIER